LLKTDRRDRFNKPFPWSSSILLRLPPLAKNSGTQHHFRHLIKDIKESLSNAIAVTAAITDRVNLSGFPIPIEPAFATGIILYIAHIGIDVFCEWSNPAAPTA
jgi:hypothetical protein